MLTLAAVTSALLAAGSVRGQEMVVLRGARMLDVETGGIVRDAVVVVEGDRIRGLGPDAVPARAPTIDLGDVTILPGLIDAHTHLAYDLEGDWAHRDATESSADMALRGVRNARRTVEAGFTTVRDVGASSGFADVALARAVDRGWIVGPRIIPAGHSLSITGGHCDATGYAPGVLEQDWREGTADGADEVVKSIRYQIEHGARVIKVCATAGVLSFEGPVGAQQYSEEELRAAVEEAARHGLKVAAHAHGTEGIKAAIRAGVASIEHGSLIDDEAVRMMKERGVYLVPTTHLADVIDLEILPAPIRAKAEWVLPRAKENLRRAIQAGVPIAFGTDAAVFPHGENGKELVALVERGMTPLDAIRTATLRAADLLGVDDRGTIAPGKLADLIAVPGNPLEDVSVLEQVRFVMLGGMVVKGP